MTYLAELRTICVFAFVVAATLGVGAPLAKLLKVRGGDLWRQLTWEAALGLTAVGTTLGLLGMCGLLYVPVIAGGTFVAAVLGGLRLRSPFANEWEIESSRSAPPAWLLRVALLATIVVAASSFISALAPPTAGDALVYHLELPKRFLQDGRLTYRADDDNATYPLLAEMGFMWVLAFDEPAAAALVHWWCGLLLAGGTYILAAPQLGAGWGRIAAAVTLLTPGVNNQMTAPLNDVALALYCVLALAAWLQARRDAKTETFALAGVMLGAALGVKYTGLVFAASLGVVWLVAALDDVGRRRMILGGAVVAALAAVAIGGMWYARAAWHRGDPLYPFLSQSHGTDGPSTFPKTKTPLGRGPVALLAAPWCLTMEPERFGGRGHQLGPLFLMFVPCAIACRSAPGATGCLAVAALYGVGCVLLRQNVRFLLPVVPVLATSAVAFWREIVRWPRVPRGFVVATTAAVLLLEIGIPVARLRHTASVTLGGESQAEYLQRTEPTYAAATWMNDHLPHDAVVLTQEQRAFYFVPNVTRENIFRRRTKYDRWTNSAEDLSAWLRGSGFTHVLTADVEGSPSPSADATLSRLTEEAAESGSSRGPVPLQEWDFLDAAGTARRYRLYLLR